jgi:hypothetical protein
MAQSACDPLVSRTAVSRPDICAFGDYFSSSRRGEPIQLLWIGAPGFFILFFTFAVTA